jgi:hypothetical protein
MMPAWGGKAIVQAVGRQLRAAPEATKVAAYSGPFASHQRGSGPCP